MNLWAVCIVLRSGDLTATAVLFILYCLCFIYFVYFFGVLFAWISFLFLFYCLKCCVHSQWYFCYPPPRTREICYWVATVLILCNNMCFICLLMTCISHSFHNLWFFFFFLLFSILPCCVCVCSGLWSMVRTLPKFKCPPVTESGHSRPSLALLIFFALYVVPLNIIFTQLSWNC